MFLFINWGFIIFFIMVLISIKLSVVKFVEVGLSWIKVINIVGIVVIIELMFGMKLSINVKIVYNMKWFIFIIYS